MGNRRVKKSSCSLDLDRGDCCRIESIVSVDERGQMVLPKELRDRAGIRSGDKLAVVSWLKDGEVCCLTLIRARHLEDHVRDFLEPVLKGVEGGARSGKETREMKPEEVKKAVRTGYANVALENAPCCGGSTSCCGGEDPAGDISRKLGYGEEELGSVPEGANLGLGCGNPLAHAALNKGDIVLDLGSGAGFDCFLAARKVGSEGKIIGVDMTPEMIEKARLNALRGEYSNVEFRLAEIEHLPVPDDCVDVVISNCVINLSPEKEQVFREAFRVLKPGGRLMVSDIVLLKEIPEAVRQSMEAYVGCVAGAVMKEDYLAAIGSAGFQEIRVLRENAFPAELVISDPVAREVLDAWNASGEDSADPAGSVVSIAVSAVKP